MHASPFLFFFLLCNLHSQINVYNFSKLLISQIYSFIYSFCSFFYCRIGHLHFPLKQYLIFMSRYRDYFCITNQISRCLFFVRRFWNCILLLILRCIALQCDITTSLWPASIHGGTKRCTGTRRRVSKVRTLC